jgi:RecA-family ATPase
MKNTMPSILARSDVRTLQPTQYLISRIILERGFVSLVAPPSSKKSFIAIDMAACVATGHAFFDRAVRKGNVLYCMAEGQAGMQKRPRTWEIFRGMEIAEA